MPRARTKKELIDFGNEEFEKLVGYVDLFEEKGIIDKPIFDNRRLKDLLAHIHAWHEMFFIWYEEGMKGEEPEIPAPGYTFKDSPALNEKLYQDYKDMPLDEILKKIKSSHKKIVKLVEKHSEEELFTKKKYAWTSSTSMGVYFASAISSHYAWASALFRKFLKKSG